MTEKADIEELTREDLSSEELEFLRKHREHPDRDILVIRVQRYSRYS